jgi:hypothetical protein
MSEFSRAFSLTGSNFLATFDLTNPTGGSLLVVTGLASGETLVGIDFRPEDGRLYGFGVDPVADTATLYVIATRTGVATPVGPLGAVGNLPADGYGMDFNPAVDLIRITTDTGLNFRINPDTGALIALDTSINGAATGVSGTAYTNNEPNAAVTTLYTLDATTDQLMIQNPPNAGTQTVAIAVTLDGNPLDFTTTNGFDIPAGVNVATSSTQASGSGFALLTVGGITGVYSIDLTTGAATRVGDFLNGALPANGLAIRNAPPGPDDVLWQHVDGVAATGVRELGLAAAGFEIQGIGDFDGDGDADIVWRNGATVLTWELINGEFIFELDQPDAPHTWRLAGTGDFDGDGDDDILWHHNEGAVTIWEMEGGNYEANHNQPDVATNWQLAGTGDFDGDGDDDIVWRRDDGAVTIWEMEDNAYVVNHNLGVVPTAWQIAGTGDFDSDSDSDILWRHDEGAVTIWEIEDAALVVNHNQPAAATTWEIEGSHDFDSDGDDDILWRHDDGQVVTWEMEDGNFVVNHNFGVADNGWQIRGTGEFDLA